MGFKLNLHPNKVKAVAKQVTANIDIETLQQSLLQKNASQLDFMSQFQKLFDDISGAISKEFFNSQYKETQLIKKLKELQSQSSKAKSIDEITALRKSFDALIQSCNSSKNIEAAKQLGINALIKKK